MKKGGLDALPGGCKCFWLGLKRTPVRTAPVPDKNGESYRLSVDKTKCLIATPGLRNSDAGISCPLTDRCALERPRLRLVKIILPTSMGCQGRCRNARLRTRSFRIER